MSWPIETGRQGFMTIPLGKKLIRYFPTHRRLRRALLDQRFRPPAPVAGTAVIVSNHMSSLETQILPCLINPIRPVTFVVKEKLVRMKIFGPIMRSRDPVTVTRTNARQDLVTVLAEEPNGSQRDAPCHLPRKHPPPGIRSREFQLAGRETGRRAGVPILPGGTEDRFLGNGKCQGFRRHRPRKKDSFRIRPAPGNQRQ